MTPKQALEVLGQATASIQANLETHKTIVMALQTLGKLVPAEPVAEVSEAA